MLIDDVFKLDIKDFFSEEVINEAENSQKDFQIAHVEWDHDNIIYAKVKYNGKMYDINFQFRKSNKFYSLCSCRNDYCIHQYLLFKLFANSDQKDFCVPPLTRDLQDYFYNISNSAYYNSTYDDFIKEKKRRFNKFLNNMKYHHECQDYKYIFKYAIPFANSLRHASSPANDKVFLTWHIEYYKFLSTFIFEHLDDLYNEFCKSNLKNCDELVSNIIQEAFYYAPIEKVIKVVNENKEMFDKIIKHAESYNRYYIQAYHQSIINILEYSNHEEISAFLEENRRLIYRFKRKLTLYYSLKNNEDYLSRIDHLDRVVESDDEEEASLMKQVLIKYPTSDYAKLYIKCALKFITKNDFKDLFSLNDDELTSCVCRTLFNDKQNDTLKKLSKDFPSSPANMYYLALDDFKNIISDFHTFDQKFNNDLIYLFYCKIIEEAKGFDKNSVRTLLNLFDYLIKIPNGVYYAYEAITYLNSHYYNYYLQELRSTIMERIGNKL